MFYARYKYLRPFLSLALDTEDFEPEEGQIDGTLAHAIERAIGIGVARAGLSMCVVWRMAVYPPPTKTSHLHGRPLNLADLAQPSIAAIISWMGGSCDSFVMSADHPAGS